MKKYVITDSPNISFIIGSSNSLASRLIEKLHKYHHNFYNTNETKYESKNILPIPNPG
jgi:hypothetical protein